MKQSYYGHRQPQLITTLKTVNANVCTSQAPIS